MENCNNVCVFAIFGLLLPPPPRISQCRYYIKLMVVEIFIYDHDHAYCCICILSRQFFLYGWMNEWEHILFLEEYKSKRDKFMDGRCGLSDDHFWLLTKLVRREVSTCSSCSKRQLQISLESRYRFWRERVGWMYE